MWICALETSSQLGEVALLDPEGRCRTAKLGAALAHAWDLLASLSALLDEAGRAPEDIDLLAVDCGPGSYTGIRVGVTAGKTLAFALGKPVVPVDSLRVLLANVDEAGAAAAAPVIDARLGQVYAAIFDLPARTPVLSDFVGTARELRPNLPPGAVVFGDATARYRDEFAGFTIGPAAWSQPRAEAVARLGAETFRAGGGVAPDDLVPRYLRASDAERRRRERHSHAP